MNKKGKVLVVFGQEMPKTDLRKYDVLLNGNKLNELIDPGSIYDAARLAEEFSQLTLPNGTRITKSFLYKGYEMWWMYYTNLFIYFCLPYTQYKKLLDYLLKFEQVDFYNPPYKNLFHYYLVAHGIKITMFEKRGWKILPRLPFGVFIQILLTILSLPLLIIMRKPIMVFVGDKFDTGKDYDFRMKYIYQELRSRKLRFVEFIRSLESWKAVLQHFFVVRRRPVIYSEAIIYLGRIISFVTLGEHRTKKQFGLSMYNDESSDKKFTLLCALHHLREVDADVWAIRLMKIILKLVGIKASYITATTDRNFHTFLGSKLNNIPTVGILHGFASLYYNVYDFLPGYDGEKSISVDKYGVWSEWWKDYYVRNSKVYKPGQLHVSGLMRPLEKDIKMPYMATDKSGPIRILFISEQLAVPEEIMPYLEALATLPKNMFTMAYRFRAYRDGFRDWLTKNRPEFLEKENFNISEGGLQDAIKMSDVVVGSHSTAVIEALFQNRVPILFYTKKWGDYFELKDYGNNHQFFANNPHELVERINNANSASEKDLNNLRERFFGDPYKNGSKWVVDQLEEAVLKGHITK